MTVKLTQDSKNDKVFAAISGIEKLTRKGMRQAMFKVGQTWLAEASREILKGKKTGQVYIVRTKSGRRRRHQASRRGETHANLTGDTRRSLSFQLKGTSELVVGYGVSGGQPAPDYAQFLDKTRPSITNALKAEQGNITGYFEQEIVKALK